LISGRQGFGLGVHQSFALDDLKEVGVHRGVDAVCLGVLRLNLPPVIRSSTIVDTGTWPISGRLDELGR
jgi:hypothetical protein